MEHVSVDGDGQEFGGVVGYVHEGVVVGDNLLSVASFADGEWEGLGDAVWVEEGESGGSHGGWRCREAGKEAWEEQYEGAIWMHLFRRGIRSRELMGSFMQICLDVACFSR